MSERCSGRSSRAGSSNSNPNPNPNSNPNPNPNREVFEGRELCTSVDADESVASGAAVRGALLGGVDEGP